MTSLLDLYKGTGTSGFDVTRSLPNQGGTYSVVGGTKTTTPAVKTPNKYINPATGQFFTPDEYASNIAKKIPISKNTGDVPKYAGDAVMNPDPSAEELGTTARNLNNARNDIASGETDPFKVGKDSGIAYSPAQLAAIEKAYAGIYDPALSEVFTKLEKKAKDDAAVLAHKNKLEEMAQQHLYDVDLKKTPTPAQSGSGVSSTGVYVAGENPTVDAWAQRIFDGNAKLTDIPASQKGMRDAVVLAIQSSGNDLTGKPTVTELGKQASAGAKELMKKFKAGAGTSAVGKSRIFGGSLAIPGTDKSNFVIDFQNLKDMLSLEGVKYLKGQGQVSDAERALLANAVTKLNLSQTEDEFQETLQSIIDRLEGNAPAVLRSPDGTQEVNIADLTPEEVKEAQDAGWK